LVACKLSFGVPLSLDEWDCAVTSNPQNRRSPLTDAAFLCR